jgi:hypothetical protein
VPGLFVHDAKIGDEAVERDLLVASERLDVVEDLGEARRALDVAAKQLFAVDLAATSE